MQGILKEYIDPEEPVGLEDWKVLKDEHDANGAA